MFLNYNPVWPQSSAVMFSPVLRSVKMTPYFLIAVIDLFVSVYVVVQFYPWFKFYFLLFLGMLMYDNEFKTKENKIFKPRIKLNHNIYIYDNKI